MGKYVCIHGHFYQPPRENPWLEEVERQDSAYPHHDWNTRITEECYRQNAASRILGPDRKIIDIVNNYSKISFDFGPTLMSWLQRHQLDVYQAVLEADRKSRTLFSGHGAAMAQAYNHMIMPLANERDQQTQVLWGIADFTARFGRRPEGMWLPETAVDHSTLDVLARAGILFTVLSPHQAKSVRPLEDTEWHPLEKDQIDTTQAYQCPLPSGRSISLFFYQGDAAQNVASGRYLENGELLAEKLLWPVKAQDERPCLAHIATDGETFGHHFRHADMALAYCLHHIESKHLAQVTVYGEFLEKHPPTQEVEIYEKSAWSCSHGVERWRSNCGCHHGHFPSGQQAYRKYLREALDWLRDRLALVYEQQMKRYCDDPWSLRNAYVQVINDRSRENIEQFLASATRTTLAHADKTQLLKLLEMQRHAMLMYTSCAWFFDDISGLEAVQVLQYASRAMQLAKETSAQDLEPDFMQMLEQAPCNARAYAHGKDVYQQLVKPCSVDLNRVGAHLALSTLWGQAPETSQVYCYAANMDSYDRHEAGNQVLATGRATITSGIVLESHSFDFAAAFLGDRNVTGAVNACLEDAVFTSMQSDLKAAFDRGDSAGMIHVMNDVFSENVYSVWHLFRDEQRHILDHLMHETWKEIEASFRQIYEHNLTTMQLMRSVNMPLPQALAAPAEFIVNQELRRIIQADSIDSTRLQDVLDQATRLGLPLDHDGLRYEAGRKVNGLMEQLEKKPNSICPLQAAESTLRALLGLTDQLDVQRAQNILFKLSKTTFQSKEKQAGTGDRTAAKWSDLFQALAQHLGVVVE
jgi:alpha-amylase/alpha-mannosidase (GH57 family)